MKKQVIDFELLAAAAQEICEIGRAVNEGFNTASMAVSEFTSAMVDAYGDHPYDDEGEFVTELAAMSAASKLAKDELELIARFGI